MIRSDQSEQSLLAVTNITDETGLRVWNDVRNAGNPFDAEPFEVLLERWKRPGTRTHVLAAEHHGRPGAAGRGWKGEQGETASVQIVRRDRDVPVDSLVLVADHLERWAFATGASKLSTYTYDNDPEEMRFWSQRGWSESVRKPVVGCAPTSATEVDPTTSVNIVTLADRPDLIRAVYDTYRESWTSAPWGDESDVLPFERWWGNIEQWPGAAPDQFFIAIEDDEVLGYAELDFGAMNNRVVAWHGYTGVRPAHQRAGIATALKAHTIAWAREHGGVTKLFAANDEENQSMRGINKRFGYRHEFSYVSFEHSYRA